MHVVTKLQFEYSCQKVPLNIEGYVPHITAQMHHLLLHWENNCFLFVSDCKIRKADCQRMS